MAGKSYRDHYLEMLSTWSAALPNKFLWLVYIDNYPQMLTSEVIREWEKNGKTGRAWDFRWDIEKLTEAHYQQVQGCIFAQGVNIPGETYSTGYAELPQSAQRGFVPAIYGDTRAGPTELTVEFRETNTSFTDFLLRPWVILSAHLGLVARKGDDPVAGTRSSKNIKTRIRVLQLGKTTRNPAKGTPTIRKIFTFYDCVPTKINNSQLTYDSDAMQLYDVTWAYRHYTVEDPNSGSSFFEDPKHIGAPIPEFNLGGG
jgi:hypothetical protein